VSTEPGTPQGPSNDQPQNIAATLADVSERATQLVREEVELAKAEVAEKVSTLLRGAVVGVVAGVFVLMALIFVLVGFAWLLYYYLPGNDFTYFTGFFAMAVILLVLGTLAGVLAAKVVKRGAPPVPEMAIDEARKIRETVSGDDAIGTGAGTTPAPPAPTEAGSPVQNGVASYTAAGQSGAGEGEG